MSVTTTPVTSTLDSGPLDEETVASAFGPMVARLNDQSVRKHFDAYVDVPWDEHPIDPADARWELSTKDPLGATAWYQAQPQDVRARLGLDLITAKMQVGYFFEGVLKRGLLEHATRLPAGSPELRYVYHEVIEESQHSLMFQEFCGRGGRATVAKVPWDAEFGSRQVVKLARRFPELFFIFVLGGEDPVDHLQRETLRAAKEDGTELHPLFERIMRIHVTEEARHLSFARNWLRERVPALGPIKRTVLAVGAPLILGEMGGMMLKPSPEIVRSYGIPKAVVREAYDDNAEFQATAATAMRKVRKLCRELGLITPVSRFIWKRKGIWQED
jgi:hypothetical protein